VFDISAEVSDNTKSENEFEKWWKSVSFGKYHIYLTDN
jgi:hypothetical protein